MILRDPGKIPCVNLRREKQIRSPGMKHRRKTDSGAELLRYLSEKQAPGTVYPYRPGDLR